MKRYEIETDGVQDIPFRGVIGEGERVSSLARSSSELPRYEEGIIPPEDPEMSNIGRSDRFKPGSASIMVVILGYIVALILLARWLT
jgi:hypothetical protein